jgi:radical SAM superfamily enzyme YgiQ (UPF0313 family)
MSLLAIGALLENEFPYCIIDQNLDPDPVATITALHSHQPLAGIAITVMPGPQLNHAVPLSRRLKAVLPGVPIIWGGYFPSQHADVILKDDYVDYCVIGQGEQTFLELARVLTGGGAVAGIAGLAYRQDGRVRHNPRRPLIPLTELPDWPYHRLEMNRYIFKHYLGNRVGTHHSSYGCPFACNFCAVVNMTHQRWLPQSPAQVERIIDRQRRDYGIDAVQFHDMDFFVSEARSAEIAERFTGKNLTWWALGRVDELVRYRDATWRKLKASGLKMVFSGAESGSVEVLRRMNKGGTAHPDKTLELAARLREYGIVPEFSFVLGNPPDPAEDIAATIAFIRRVKAVNPATEIILYTYTPVPLDGTLYEEARKLGFGFPQRLDDWVSGDWRAFALRRDPKTPWLNRRLQRRIRNFERVLNAYYPTTTDLRLTGWRRGILRALSAWRYHARCYGAPYELRVLQRLFRYQRPETTGF